MLARALALALLAVPALAGVTTVTVPANASGGVATGIVVAAGQNVLVTATGQTNWTTPGGSLHDPDGQPGCFIGGAGFLLPGACRMALVGSVAGTPFLVGSSFSGTMPAAGELILAVNDDFYGDNQGSLEVQIQVVPVGKPHRMYVYVDEPDFVTDSTGHAFVEFEKDPGSGSKVTAGFYPGDPVDGLSELTKDKPGRVRYDGSHPWDWRICYWLGSADFDKALARVAVDLPNPPSYNLGQHNCMNWASTIAGLAGIALPTFEKDTLASPWRLGLSCQAIGDCGAAPGGGVVEKNPAAPAPTAGGACLDWDPWALATRTHTDVAAVAAETGLAFATADLGLVTVDPGTPLTWTVSNVIPNEAVVSVEWGDGSEMDVQAFPFAHAFAAGTYAASLSVVDSGAIHVFTLTVDVFAGGGTPAPVDAFVPSTAPVELFYPDCAPVPPFTLVSDATVYCTAKANSLGCVPLAVATGTPSATDPLPYDVLGFGVLNFRNGLLFYGKSGRAALPFLGGTLCVMPPLQRLPLQNAGGTPPPAQDCTGILQYDFNALVQGGLDPFLVPGQQVNAQWWTRDPAQADGTGVGLTDGVEFTVQP